VVDWIDTEDADLCRRAESILSVYRGLVVLVILVIAGAAVLTTMMKAVRERTREIGTLRSLGYRRHHLLAMFAAESSLLAMCAGLCGLLCAVAITAAINSSRITYKAGLMAESITLRIGYFPVAYALGFLFLSLVAVAAALTAARHVTRMRIAETLADA
jgi:putative ABC transport system permease protein